MWKRLTCWFSMNSVRCCYIVGGLCSLDQWSCSGYFVTNSLLLAIRFRHSPFPDEAMGDGVGTINQVWWAVWCRSFGGDEKPKARNLSNNSRIYNFFSPVLTNLRTFSFCQICLTKQKSPILPYDIFIGVKENFQWQIFLISLNPNKDFAKPV